MCKKMNKKCKKCSSNKKSHINKTSSKRKKRKRHQKGGGVLDKIKGLKGKLNNKMRSNALKKSSGKATSGKFDLHGATLSMVNKIFGKRGMVPPPYKYLGPGNPLLKQLVIGKNGKISKYKVKTL